MTNSARTEMARGDRTATIPGQAPTETQSLFHESNGDGDATAAPSPLGDPSEFGQSADPFPATPIIYDMKDEKGIPYIKVDFEAAGVTIREFEITLDQKDSLDCMDTNKVMPGSQVWLSDGTFRVMATIHQQGDRDGNPMATVHWGTSQEMEIQFYKHEITSGDFDPRIGEEM